MANLFSASYINCDAGPWQEFVAPSVWPDDISPHLTCGKSTLPGGFRRSHSPKDNYLTTEGVYASGMSERVHRARLYLCTQ